MQMFATVLASPTRAAGTPRLRLRAWVAVFCFVAACSDQVRPAGTLIPDSGSGETTSEVKAKPSDDECADKADGADCGSAGKHCVRKRCLFNSCGDGVKAGIEGCDDGNQIDGDGCDSDCQPECGNGKVDPGEACDDGNDDDDDGCTNHCSTNQCGNKRTEPGEECDDGNQDDADSCSNSCKKNECGNGRVDPGEDCDDGKKNGDGDKSCPKTCLRARCRNGRLDPGEECDDGNQIDTDGCNNRCKIMICGDGKQQDREECDDGNQVDTDSCSNNCTKIECGNGRIDPGEECEGQINCDHCKKPKDDLCKKCEDLHCRTDFPPDEGLMIDWLAGCFEDKPDPMYVMGFVAPGSFSGPCSAIVSCARENKCITDPVQGAQKCLCGSASASDCSVDESKADGPCKALYQAASSSTIWGDVFKRIEDPKFPLGYASWLLKCDALRCRAECAPWATDGQAM